MAKRSQQPFLDWLERHLAESTNLGSTILNSTIGRMAWLIAQIEAEVEQFLLDCTVECLVPGFDGALFSQQWKDALWVRFSTGAPARQRQSVEQYKIVKRA